MTFDSATPLDQLTAGAQREVVFNTVTAAMSPAALFGVKPYVTAGLRLALYGGNWPNTDGTIGAIADQIVALTASATNYISASLAGAVTKVTSAPAGWPGPLANGRALYQLTVDANGITGGTDYVTGVGVGGGSGPTGPTGPSGDELNLQRLRVWEQAGHGALGPSDGVAICGFTSTLVVGSISTRLLDASTFSEALGRIAYATGSGSTGQSVQVRSGQNLFWLGNAAGRGGFKVSMRFVLADSSYTQVNQRSFFGLYDVANSPIGNVEPDTLINIVGIGAKLGDANLSVMCNDGSGTATMTTLGSGFPAKTTESTYELVLSAPANGSAIAYTVLNAGTGATASGSLSSNIPSNTTFLGWTMWINNGTSTGATAFSPCQVTGNSRY